MTNASIPATTAIWVLLDDDGLLRTSLARIWRRWPNKPPKIASSL